MRRAAGARVDQLNELSDRLGRASAREGVNTPEWITRFGGCVGGLGGLDSRRALRPFPHAGRFGGAEPRAPPVVWNGVDTASRSPSSQEDRDMQQQAAQTDGHTSNSEDLARSPRRARRSSRRGGCTRPSEPAFMRLPATDLNPAEQHHHA